MRLSYYEDTETLVIKIPGSQHEAISYHLEFCFLYQIQIMTTPPPRLVPEGSTRYHGLNQRSQLPQPGCGIGCATQLCNRLQILHLQTVRFTCRVFFIFIL
jgi:hypothetical protein